MLPTPVWKGKGLKCKEQKILIPSHSLCWGTSRSVDRSATTLCLSLVESPYRLPYSSVIPTGLFWRLVRVIFPQTASAVASDATDMTKWSSPKAMSLQKVRRPCSDVVIFCMSKSENIILRQYFKAVNLQHNPFGWRSWTCGAHCWSWRAILCEFLGLFVMSWFAWWRYLMNTAAAWCMAFDISSVIPGVKLAFPILLPVARIYHPPVLWFKYV